MIKKKYRSGKTGSADALGRGASRGMPETTPLIKAALNLRVGAGFDVYEKRKDYEGRSQCGRYYLDG